MQMGVSNSKNVVEHQRTESPIQQGPGLDQGFQRITIGSLPDDVLLVIFAFYQVVIDQDKDEFPWNWEKLVHVCQRWRYLIFESPIHLNLQLFCTTLTPVRKLLDVWPPFPLVILDYNKYGWSELDEFDEAALDNTAAALEHRDRVHRISISYPSNSLRKRILTAMQEPFPALRSLSFRLHEGLSGRGDHLPATFLNGSAPCLQHLAFLSVSFPLLPRLLSSTSDLTSLHLNDIPNSGYIPPEEMATSLSALPKLKSLIISFRLSPLLHPQSKID
ncbi:hypothetical protein BGW80DRAFT_1561745 [Lactifluus volemus]|nr:hypothetical protein BGW80DRAFT_1561745 [Lactifluus volemus]